MPSSANAALVPRDPTLPGLATLLDPVAFTKALRLALPDVDVGEAQATYVRYKPGTNCVVAYQLTMAGTALKIYAKTHRPDAHSKLQKARAHRSAPNLLGMEPLILDDHVIEVHGFPNDRKLKSLKYLASPQTQSILLRKLLADRPDLWGGTLHCLQYKPERRYVARLDVAQQPQAVLKFYTPYGYRVAKLAANRFTSQGCLRIVPLLHHSNRRHILSFEWLAGQRLREFIVDVDDTTSFNAMVLVGAALAELHAQSPKGLPYRTGDMDTASLQAQANMISHLCPQLATRATNLVKRLAALLADEPAVSRPIHGDFYDTQVLLTGDVVAILDLDEAVYGNPAADLGLFIAHLQQQVLCGALSANRVQALKDAILGGYRRQAKQQVTPHSIELYTAIGLMQLASHPFRLQQPDWAARIASILTQAEAVLNSKSCMGPGARQTIRANDNSGTAAVPVSDPFHVTDDAQMPFLKQALEPVVAQTQLANALAHTAGDRGYAHLQAIRVLRYKPGRRCLIEYDIALEKPGAACTEVTLIGKARARGLDKTTYRLSNSLVDAGFGADCEDGIAVPPVAGMIPEFQMWLQYKVPGTVATELLSGPDGITLAGRIAEVAHKLHTTGISPRRRHTMADELRILHDRLAVVAQMQPQWKTRLQWVLDACDRLGTTVPVSVPVVGIHRDFYSDQVLVDGNRLYLVDLDLYCAGDPALDIGNFIGHLTEQGLRTLGDANALIEQEQSLQDRFLQLAGDSLRGRVQAYAVLTLVRHLYISTRFVDRQPYTESLLELCEQRLDLRSSVFTEVAL